MISRPSTSTLAHLRSDLAYLRHSTSTFISASRHRPSRTFQSFSDSFPRLPALVPQPLRASALVPVPLLPFTPSAPRFSSSLSFTSKVYKQLLSHLDPVLSLPTHHPHHSLLSLLLLFSAFTLSTLLNPASLLLALFTPDPPSSQWPQSALCYYCL